MRVMIIDNDRAWARSLKILLMGRRYETCAFTDPLQACASMEQIAGTDIPPGMNRPDALILDYAMPEMNGFEVLERIRDRLAPKCKVLLVTGHGDRLDEAELKQHGIAAYIEKPVDLETLEQALKGGIA